MKTNFSPQLQFMDMTGVGTAAQAVAGLTQTVGGWIQQHKATKALEKLNSPSYSQNQSILDYFSKALQRYNVDPYTSTQYKKAVQDTSRSTAQGLEALRGRGGAVAGVNSIIANQNDNLLKAATEAENRKAQEFNVLRDATQLKAGEDDKAYQYNKFMPYERKYNLLAMKAGGGNQIMNAGLQNIYGAGSSLAQMDMIKKQNKTGG